jgi:nicotinamide mononucleotide transporter
MADLSWLELAGFATGAVSVWLAVVESVWTWPTGIANNGVFLALFLQSRLFADSALQVVYVVLSLAGWVLWLRGRGGSGRRPIARLTARDAAAVLAALAGATRS